MSGSLIPYARPKHSVESRGGGTPLPHPLSRPIRAIHPPSLLANQASIKASSTPLWSVDLDSILTSSSSPGSPVITYRMYNK